MADIWEVISFEDVLHNVPNSELPDCNRGSWFCPVATKSDAQSLDYQLRKRDIDRIYDLGAGTLQFSVEMDKRGYDVIAYESLQDVIEYSLSQLPENDIDVRNRDYYSDWNKIKDDRAAFVALGKMNHVPETPENGFVVDGMSV